MISPLVADGTVSVVEDDPIHTIVTSIAYIKNIDMYAYELEGLVGWYNESWLQYDVYGTKTIRIVEIDRQADNRAQIDAILDEINDYKRLSDVFKDDKYANRIEELKAELSEMTKGAID